MKTYVYVVVDSCGQGLIDRGVIAIFSTLEKTKEFIGNSWYSIKEVELDFFYIDGI